MELSPWSPAWPELPLQRPEEPLEARSWLPATRHSSPRLPVGSGFLIDLLSTWCIESLGAAPYACFPLSQPHSSWTLDACTVLFDDGCAKCLFRATVCVNGWLFVRDWR
jgi:hypothetical protein